MTLASFHRQRTVNARVDLTKLSLPLVRRAFGLLLMSDSPAMTALDIAETWGGVRPVKAGARVRNRLVLISVEPQASARLLVKVKCTLEIEGETKPALVAEMLCMLIGRP